MNEEYTLEQIADFEDIQLIEFPSYKINEDLKVYFYTSNFNNCISVLSFKIINGTKYNSGFIPVTRNFVKSENFKSEMIQQFDYIFSKIKAS